LSEQEVDERLCALFELEEYMIFVLKIQGDLLIILKYSGKKQKNFWKRMWEQQLITVTIYKQFIWQRQYLYVTLDSK